MRKEITVSKSIGISRKIGAILLSAAMGISLMACGSTGGSGTAGTAVSTGAESASAETAAEMAASDAEPGMVTVTDHAGRTVTVPKDPKRIVVLDILPLPATLTVFLNSAESLVAMEPASMNAAKNGILSELYPEILQATTEIMNGDDVNVESLLNLNPDIVFYHAKNSELAEKLENSGLTCVAVSATKWNYDCIETYDQWISLLSQIFPSAPAARRSQQSSEFAREMYEKIQAATGKLKEEEKKKVLFLFKYDENTMVTSGARFFGQWWCDAAGAVNTANGVAAENSSAVITMEQVYEWNPDAIILTNFTKTLPEDLYNNAIGEDDWSTVKAVQEKQVYKMPLGSYRTYTPGIDTPMTLEWLAGNLYPELFPEFQIQEDVKKYYHDLYDIELTDEQYEKMYNPARAAGQLN